MPKLIIDDRTVEVPEGTKVIEAAERVGIHIPRFCYHPALGSVGACRVCAVKFLQGPFHGVQMSCMVDAADGMVVSTTDEEAVDFRRHVIEWLMINHPHDCPVCDEGGHCLLQDMTVSGGHGLRFYQGKKRTYRDQDLGPLVAHEMNRCIQCYRCSRYYQEYAGYHDLGVMGIASRVYFGRFRSGALESPFSGNLIDVCPTGVYTDRPSRYKGRRWDYQRTPSVCIHCSLGCRTTVDVRYREVVRIEARFSPTVNGHFICDRGRYGFFYASAETRPRRARVGGAETAYSDAHADTVRRISSIVAHHGPETIAVVGSARSTLETLSAESRICRDLGWQGPVLFDSAAEHEAARRAAGLLTPELAVSLEGVKSADLVLVAGVDPINEAPMLAMALRQAQRNGAQIEVFDPRPVSMPVEFRHWPVDGAGIAARLRRLAENQGEGSELHRDLIDRLDRCRRPVVVCDASGIAGASTVEQAAGLARMLFERGKRAGLFYVMAGANSFAAARLSGTPADVDTLLPLIEEGGVRALVIVENDLLSTYPDLARLTDSLAGLDLLVVLDCLDSATVNSAHVFFPTQTVFETGGTFVNNEARIQQAPAAFAGGAPITQTGGGSHPPRDFRPDIPGAEPQPARSILLDLASALGGGASSSAGAPEDELAGIAPEFSGFDPVEASGERGAWTKLPLAASAPASASGKGGEKPPGEGG
ncbi:MAG: NADH-quinone oxidoreductase subunit NuoG, partial [Desulfobacterales bacterium]